MVAVTTVRTLFLNVVCNRQTPLDLSMSAIPCQSHSCEPPRTHFPVLGQVRCRPSRAAVSTTIRSYSGARTTTQHRIVPLPIVTPKLREDVVCAPTHDSELAHTLIQWQKQVCGWGGQRRNNMMDMLSSSRETEMAHARAQVN